MADKKISQLETASAINPADFSVMVSNNVDYQFTFSLLLTFLSANLSTGANVSFGTAIPSNTIGKNGDVFVKTDTQQFVQKIGGTWTVVYTVSSTGAMDGTVLYGMSTPPSPTIGNNNDTYINTLTGVFYNKASGAWSQVFSMASGPQGPRGNSILNGAIDPTDSIGINGDFYLNTVSETIFGPKASGTWPTPGTSLKGQDGNTVLSGSINPTNSQGKDGDFYLNYITYYLFGPKAAGSWPIPGVSLVGSALQPLQFNYPKGSPNPIFIDWSQYSADLGPKPTVQIEVRQITAISAFGAIIPGSGYVDGNYQNIKLTGGAGHGAIANIVVSGGAITSVQIVAGGIGYAVSDSLTAALSGGSGFSISVQTIGNSYIKSSFSEQYNMDSTNATVQSIVVNAPDATDNTITSNEIRVTLKQ